MNKSISSILWPSDRREAVRLCLEYMVSVLNRLEIFFQKSDHNPLVYAERLIAVGKRDGEWDAELAYWWRVADGFGVRNFQDKDAIMARIAISVLSVKEDDSLSLGDQLSWFIELIGFLDKDVNIAVEIMQSHFKFSSSS